MMISDPKKKLLDLIKHHGQLTIDESVDKMDLAKTTVREHFTQLEKEAYIERSYERSGRGRPSLQFRLTNKGNALYPTNEPQLMREFIRYLQTEGEHELLEGFFQKYWENRRKTVESELKALEPESDYEKAEIVSQMLDNAGFMPEFFMDQKSDTLKIKECNCPFREIVKVTKLPCKLEEEFYQRVFKKNVNRITYIAEGDFACTYCVK